MPMLSSGSIIARSRSSHGSACTIRSSDWKKRRSYGMVESYTALDASTKRVAGGLFAFESGYTWIRFAYATAAATSASLPLSSTERSSA